MSRLDVLLVDVPEVLRMKSMRVFRDPGRHPPRGQLGSAHIVALGDGPLVRWDHEETAALIKIGGGPPVLLCPRGAGIAHLPRWITAGFERIATPGELAKEIAALRWKTLARLLGPPPLPQVWTKGRALPGTAAETACLAVPHLEASHSVQEWRELLGWGRKRLERVCRQFFSSRPQEVLFLWIRHRVEAGRAAGLGWTELARLLGYSNGSNLKKALRRRGIDPSRIPVVRA